MLSIDRITDVSGREMPGFFVRNAKRKILAIGAFSQAHGFVMPSRKRYARDISLCEALGRITGLPVKWNIGYYGKIVCSGTEQELMRKVRQSRRFA